MTNFVNNITKNAIARTDSIRLRVTGCRMELAVKIHGIIWERESVEEVVKSYRLQEPVMCLWLIPQSLSSLIKNKRTVERATTTEAM